MCCVAKSCCLAAATAACISAGVLGLLQTFFAFLATGSSSAPFRLRRLGWGGPGWGGGVVVRPLFFFPMVCGGLVWGGCRHRSGSPPQAAVCAKTTTKNNNKTCNLSPASSSRVALRWWGGPIPRSGTIVLHTSPVVDRAQIYSILLPLPITPPGPAPRPARAPPVPVQQRNMAQEATSRLVGDGPTQPLDRDSTSDGLELEQASLVGSASDGPGMGKKGRQRVLMGVLGFFMEVICYADRTNISLAILPMAAEHGYNAATCAPPPPPPPPPTTQNQASTDPIADHVEPPPTTHNHARTPPADHVE
eukprot:COSAG04_NODE_1793_length_5565_cov_52.214782_9_plen_306_part_00